MSRVNKAHVVEDPSDDELNDAGQGRGGGGDGYRHHRAQNFRFSLALWSISPHHVAMTKQEIFCVKAMMSFFHQRLD